MHHFLLIEQATPAPEKGGAESDSGVWATWAEATVDGALRSGIHTGRAPAKGSAGPREVTREN